MSREIFMAAARVHAMRALEGTIGAFQLFGNGYFLYPYFQGADEEADLALAWLALAEREHPGLLTAEEAFAEQRELGLVQELVLERLKFREACTVARDAIGTLCVYDRDFAQNLGSRLKKIEGPVT